MNAQCCKVRMVGREGKPTGGSVACSQAKEGGRGRKGGGRYEEERRGKGEKAPSPRLTSTAPNVVPGE